MTHENETTYLCLLDNLHIDKDVILDEFSILRHNAIELSSLLRGVDDCNISKEYQRQIERYSNFPWAHLNKECPQDAWEALLNRDNLLYLHAGEMSWEPFKPLIQTLNLLKPSDGPIFARQFYCRPFSHIQTADQIKKIIYAEPYELYDNNGNVFDLAGYSFDAKDKQEFVKLREQLKKCISDKSVDNTHINIAIHHFENADRKLTPKEGLLPGSFYAIDPLMSYEASLEALIIEDKYETEKKLSSRVPSIIKDNTKSVEISNFIKRVFWLRSKYAHGVNTVYELEKYIVVLPNAEIKTNDKKRGNIPSGNYEKILIKGSYFPGFLVNLREICRRCIRFFCDEYIQGHDRQATIEKLDKY